MLESPLRNLTLSEGAVLNQLATICHSLGAVKAFAVCLANLDKIPLESGLTVGGVPQRGENALGGAGGASTTRVSQP